MCIEGRPAFGGSILARGLDFHVSHFCFHELSSLSPILPINSAAPPHYLITLVEEHICLIQRNSDYPSRQRRCRKNGITRVDLSFPDGNAFLSIVYLFILWISGFHVDVLDSHGRMLRNTDSTCFGYSDEKRGRR